MILAELILEYGGGVLWSSGGKGAEGENIYSCNSLTIHHVTVRLPIISRPCHRSVMLHLRIQTSL